MRGLSGVGWAAVSIHRQKGTTMFIFMVLAVDANGFRVS